MSNRTPLRRIVIVVAISLSALSFAADLRAQEGEPKAMTPAAPMTKPKLIVVGDSTASNGADLGWGSHLASFFDTTKITVLNRAIGGRSSRSFQAEGQWTRVMNELGAGDFVLIQFGHNDGGDINNANGRPSLSGLGEETRDVMKMAMRGGMATTETVHTFGWYMRKYVTDTREKKALPIVLSRTVRSNWRGAEVERGPGQMSTWAEQVAKSQDALFLDLNNIVGEIYEQMGQDKVKPMFPRDTTHTNADGAELNAKSVVSGLKILKDHPLDAYYSAKGKAVEPYEPLVRQPADPAAKTATPPAEPTAPKMPADDKAPAKSE